MSTVESNKSKYGGVSESRGLLRNVSGELAATEASFLRNGSLGLIGGIGILTLFLGFMEQNVVKFRLPELTEDEIEQEAIGTCKQFAIAFLFLCKFIVDVVQKWSF